MIISTEVQIKSQNASFKREIQIRRENQCAERNYIFRERDFGQFGLISTFGSQVGQLPDLDLI